ncbi:MAG: NADH:ubiquinone oxidoreductase [Candidatus Bathyarchaeota archaeon]|nr:NADH:ubiquinone oxidoreductase [Candidatus Bathyarchaeota archaeon]
MSMRPKVAFFDFASCEGCQLQIANLEDELLDVLSLIEPVNFREVMTERSDDYAVAFIEGACTRPHDEERLKEIRSHAAILVAYGACAHLGGVNCMKNFFDQDQVRAYVYGDKAAWFDTYPARPISAVVKVDAVIPGCPVDKNEVLATVKALLMGKTPRLPDYPVCVECKLAENVCVFEKGLTCLGPVTRAGCGAVCPSFGNKCLGCRGLVDNPNLNAHKGLLQERGLTVDQLLNSFRMFDGYLEVAK